MAGSFYPADPAELRALVTSCLAGGPNEPTSRLAAMVPHAGLAYSGRCAGEVFRRIALPSTIVILAPNHTGACGSPGASLWRAGAFETPLGAVPIEEAFAAALEQTCDLVAHDPRAHEREHAVEVELPFIQVRSPVSAIVPLVLAWDDWSRSEALAAALAETCAAWPGPVLLIASSDMTHHESARTAKRRDELALARVRALDGRGLLETCAHERVTMCGRAPAAVAIEAARRLGASRGTVVDYRHSGLVTGDHASVVAYAGVLVS